MAYTGVEEVETTKRIQIQMGEGMYEALRRRAFERRQSLAATIREALEEKLGARGRRRPALRDFPARPDNVSGRHDEVLGDGPSAMPLSTMRKPIRSFTRS